MDKLGQNTSYYIQSYLDPGRKWNREVSGKQRIDLIRCADVNWTAVTDHIKKMNYHDFLSTPYWKAIAAHTRYKAGYRCQLCNWGANLTTHHRNYRIHGREHAHVNELIVLCNRCHQKFHGREETIDKARPSDGSDITYAFVVGVAILFIAYLFIQGKGTV